MRLNCLRTLTGRVLGSALLLSGCGSTVAMTSQGTIAGVQDGTGFGAPTDSASAGAGNTLPTGSSGSVGGNQQPVPEADAASSATGPRVPGAASHVRGTTGPVKIGYFVLKDTGAAFAALGYGGLSSGNGTTQVATAAKLANDKGGIGGRKIVPVVFQVDATQSTAQQFAAACSLFFEDNHVGAVVSVIYSDALSECAKSHGVPLISDSNASTSSTATARNPLLVLPNQLSVERASTTLVKGLTSSGWLSASKKPVIGLITHSDPAYKNVEPTIRAALSRAGLALKDTYYFPSDQVSSGPPAGKSAALKFASEGIDHVLGLDTGFGMSWFTLSAGQQHYYPKLGMTSLSLPGGFPLLFTDQQLDGSEIVGWSPALDTTPSNQPAVSGRTPACVKAMSAAGQDMGADLARMQAEELCDATWFLTDTFSTGTISGAAMRAGLDALGHGFASTVAFQADPRNNRFAASAYRNAAYASSCRCYLYRGPLHAVS